MKFNINIVAILASVACVGNVSAKADTYYMSVRTEQGEHQFFAGRSLDTSLYARQRITALSTYRGEVAAAQAEADNGSDSRWTRDRLRRAKECADARFVASLQSLYGPEANLPEGWEERSRSNEGDFIFRRVVDKWGRDVYPAYGYTTYAPPAPPPAPDPVYVPVYVPAPPVRYYREPVCEVRVITPLEDKINRQLFGSNYNRNGRYIVQEPCDYRDSRDYRYDRHDHHDHDDHGDRRDHRR